MAGFDFGNYPNMGHCVVENTVNSMRQLVDGLAEARDKRAVEDLNQYERRAYNELYDLCETVMAEMDRLEEAEVEEFEEEEYDEEDF